MDNFINFNKDKNNYMFARLNDDDTAIQVRLIGTDQNGNRSVAMKDLTKDELIIMAEFFTRKAAELYPEG